MTNSSDDETLARLGRRIRRLRQEQDLTLEEVGRRADLTRMSVGRVEAGKANPSTTTLGRIADALGVSIGSLYAPETGVLGSPDGTARTGARTVTVVRADRRSRMTPWEGWFLDLDSPASGRRFRVAVDSVEPGGPGLQGGPAVDVLVLVLAGSCELTTGAEVQALAEGDCAYLTHQPGFVVRASGDEPARILWLTLPLASVADAGLPVRRA